MTFTLVVPDECRLITLTIISDKADRIEIRQAAIEPTEGSKEVILAGGGDGGTNDF